MKCSPNTTNNQFPVKTGRKYRIDWSDSGLACIFSVTTGTFFPWKPEAYNSARSQYI